MSAIVFCERTFERTTSGKEKSIVILKGSTLTLGMSKIRIVMLYHRGGSNAARPTYSNQFSSR